MMFNPGDVVLVDFSGAQTTKVRPAIVVSSLAYHLVRPDVVVALLTTQLQHATTEMDYVLQDWTAAGLYVPSAYRSYFETFETVEVIRVLGRLSDRDWAEVQTRLRLALAV